MWITRLRVFQAPGGNVGKPAVDARQGRELFRRACHRFPQARHCPQASLLWASEDSAPKLPAFLASSGVKPHIPAELLARFSSPIVFRPKRGGRQLHIADAAEALLRGLARVGVIALVDEAAGYQDERSRDALAKLLQKFVAKELRRWVRVFPADFYKEMFRLHGWPYSDISTARPGVVGNYTTNLVYDRLAPFVRDEILRVIPRNDAGKPKGKVHQMLTENYGDPRLREHLAALVALMKASSSWTGFMSLVDRALPCFGSTMILPMPLDGSVSAPSSS